MEEYRNSSALADRIETFASPATISAAKDLLNSVEGIRFVSFNTRGSGDTTIWQPERRKAYWAYAEAHYKFMLVARKEMGLKPPPVPPGLARYRGSSREEAKKGTIKKAEVETEEPES